MLISGKWNLQGQKKKSANPGKVLSPSIHVGALMALICILNLRLTLGKPMERGFYRPLSGLSGGLAGLPPTRKGAKSLGSAGAFGGLGYQSPYLHHKNDFT